MKNIDRKDPVWETVRDFLTTQVSLVPGSVVLCACSGGKDSVCLLHSLLAVCELLDVRVIAAHYNHGLRGEESERDAEFVRELARNFGIELISETGDVAGQAKVQGCGIEEMAREMRYAFLQRAAQSVGAQAIATAHNANDNAETLLMRLLRGTGTRGLSGIPPIRENIIRPLLSVSRQEIEAYLFRHSLSHVEDSSNFEDIYTRNRIRHQLLPMLEEMSPGILERLNRTAEHLRMDEIYLREEAEKLANQAKKQGNAVRISAALLGESHPALAMRVVRRLLKELRTGNDNCSAVHLKSLLALCKGNNVSGEVHLPGGLTARREYEMLVLMTQQENSPLIPCLLELPGQIQAGQYCLKCREYRYQGEEQQSFCFFLSQKYNEIFVRARRTGDMLYRPGRKRKSLKKLFIDEKIPLQVRNELPVLEISDQVAAVAGLGPDIAFLPSKGEMAWEIKIIPIQKSGYETRKEGNSYAGEGHSGSII